MIQKVSTHSPCVSFMTNTAVYFSVSNDCYRFPLPLYINHTLSKPSKGKLCQLEFQIVPLSVSKSSEEFHFYSCSSMNTNQNFSTYTSRNLKKKKNPTMYQDLSHTTPHHWENEWKSDHSQMIQKNNPFKGLYFMAITY